MTTSRKAILDIGSKVAINLRAFHLVRLGLITPARPLALDDRCWDQLSMLRLLLLAGAPQAQGLSGLTPPFTIHPQPTLVWK